jgi:predicted ATPase
MKYFAPFGFDVDEGTLWRGSQPVRLTRKAGALLRCLLERAGGWVSKSDIMAAVWPDTYVQPDNVKVLVREIRQALGDQHRAAKFIRSEAGRGYAFVAPVADHGSRRAAQGLGPRTPIFVNRGPELASLADALDAVRASARRLVLVSGDHGIGKTALCEAFARTAAAGGPVRISVGQCFDRELPHEPYYPFLDALVRLDRRHPLMVPPILTQHAPSWLAQFPQWVGARPPAVHPVRMLDELGAALDALAHDLPLIIVLEDLQWADADTVHALARLAASHMPSKLLVVGTFCDCEWTAGERAKHRLLHLATANPRCTTLTLGPLTEEHVTRYIDARFGPDCLSDLSASVHQATGGNAFMMVSAIDSLVARKLVIREADGWMREGSIQTIARALPETLGEAVVRQLDQLDAREREALEAAAAIGLSFTASAVAVALQSRVEEVRRVLGPLSRRGHLIVPAGGTDASRPVQGSYRFRHPLCADVIAQRAPMLRQLRLAERLNSTGDIGLRRA